MKLLKFVSASGWFAGWWGAVFSLGGLLVAVVPWFLDVHIGYRLLWTFVGSAISLLGSYEAKAKQFGYPAPFTNDPLGWRKAKKSYEQESRPESEDSEKR